MSSGRLWHGSEWWVSFENHLQAIVRVGHCAQIRDICSSALPLGLRAFECGLRVVEPLVLLLKGRDLSHIVVVSTSVTLRTATTIKIGFATPDFGGPLRFPEVSAPQVGWPSWRGRARAASSTGRVGLVSSSMKASETSSSVTSATECGQPNRQDSHPREIR